MNEHSIEFIFPFSAMSLNHYHQNTKNGRRFISQKGKKHTARMEWLLRSCNEEIKKFKLLVDPQCGFHVEQINYFIAKDIITKKGEISKKSCDVDNLFKIQVDTIFNVIGYNDKLISRIVGEKQITNEPNSYFTFKIIGFKYGTSKFKDNSDK